MCRFQSGFCRPHISLQACLICPTTPAVLICPCNFGLPFILIPTHFLNGRNFSSLSVCNKPLDQSFTQKDIKFWDVTSIRGGINLCTHIEILTELHLKIAMKFCFDSIFISHLLNKSYALN